MSEFIETQTYGIQNLTLDSLSKLDSKENKIIKQEDCKSNELNSDDRSDDSGYQEDLSELSHGQGTTDSEKKSIKGSHTKSTSIS